MDQNKSGKQCANCTKMQKKIHKDKKTLVLTSTKPVDINFSIKILTLKKDYELLKLNGFQEAAGYGLLLPIALPFSKIFKFFYGYLTVL